MSKWVPEAKIYPKNYSPKLLRKYSWMIGKKFLQRRCEICKTLNKLHVHHKNRKVYDNRIENLQILCYICHFNEHREELSAFRKKSILERYANGWKNYQYGKPIPLKTRKLISKKLKGRIFSPDTRLKMSISAKKRCDSKWRKRQGMVVSKRLKGKKFTKIHRENLRNSVLRRLQRF